MNVAMNGDVGNDPEKMISRLIILFKCYTNETYNKLVFSIGYVVNFIW